MIRRNEMVLESPYIHRRTFSAHNLFFAHSSKTFIVFDFFIILLIYNLGLFISPYKEVIWGTNEMLVISLVHAFSTISLNIGLGYYDFRKRFALGNLVINSFLSNSLALMASISVAYLGFYSTFGRLGLLYGVSASYSVILFLKLLLRAYVLKNSYNIAIVGESNLVERIKNQCKQKKLLFNCVNIKINPDNIEKSMHTLKKERINTLVCGSKIVQHTNFVDLSIAASGSGISVSDDFEFYTYLFEHIPVERINNRWLFHMGLARQSNLFLFFKRIFDLSFSFSALIILSPLLIFIALLIKMTSKGPALFIQSRLGRYSKPFNIYKFRTMVHTPKKSSANKDATSVKDERLTWLGKIIRPLHLDELPQLINILKGDMSLVGVRPETIPYAHKMRELLPIYHLRDVCRPGITGHAQLSMPYPQHVFEDTKKKIGYDFYYLVNQGFLLDIKIVFSTFFSVLFPIFYREFSKK